MDFTLNTKLSKYDNNIIAVNINTYDGFPHFVHVMEYFYYAIDKMLQYPDHLIILFEPRQFYKSYYVENFINSMHQLVDNFIYVNKNFNISKYKVNHGYVYKHNKDIINDDFIYFKCNILHMHEYLNWFYYKNSRKMRDLFFPEFPEIKNKIGIINRKDSRRILNIDEIVNKIQTNYNIKPDIAFFEKENFYNQLKFFRSHNIIIAPHGAALANIPFLPNNALIIEYCHDEWHPYYYFPGLSYSCGNYHALVCNNPAVFPSWYSSDYDGKQKKLNIIADIDKIINIIDNYYNNNFKNKTCYLF
tara:strand:+ start:3305 stop:4213 length:909 start_codon:yes stop_codon:yes gene_type:complete